jgi:hypothetical protein
MARLALAAVRTAFGFAAATAFDAPPWGAPTWGGRLKKGKGIAHSRLKCVQAGDGFGHNSGLLDSRLLPSLTIERHVHVPNIHPGISVEPMLSYRARISYKPAMATKELRYGAFQCLVSEPATGSAPWPLLCFLHGRDEAAPAPINVALTRHGPLRPGSSQRATDFIIVAPQLPAPGGNIWGNYAAQVREAVEAIPNADPNRRYLTGFSYGANGVLRLAEIQPPFWAALWAVDPPGERSTQRLGRPIRISFGPYSRGDRNTFETQLGPASSDVVYIDRHLDHVRTAEEAYIDNAPYAWLLTKRL